MRDRRPVCVLSFGRSGTSLVARALNLMGIDLGPEEGMLPASDWNPTGFWEQRAIMELNDEILAHRGGSYWEPPPSEPGWQLQPGMAPFRKRARELVDSTFEEQRRWGFKDPRTIFTLPLWREVVGEMDYIICVRDPLDAVASLHSREPDRPPARLLERWLQFNCEALRQTTGRRRHFVFYEEWFEEPAAVARDLAAFVHGTGEALDPKTWAAIADHFDPGLRRTRAGETSALTPKQVPLEMRTLSVLMHVLAAQEQGRAPARPEIEALAILMDAAAQARAATEQLADRLQSENQCLRTELDELSKELESQRAVLEGILSSTSWRLTAPLRSTKRKVEGMLA